MTRPDSPSARKFFLLRQTQYASIPAHYEEDAMTYRKRKGRDTWHYCRNCSNWPTRNYVQSRERKGGELCNECKAKRKNRECTE